jgi:hypothetical protein
MDANSKVEKLPLLSKTWNRACQSPASWRSIFVFTTRGPSHIIENIYDNNNALMRLLPRLSRLEVLWCEGTHLTDSVLFPILEVCGPRLRALCIEFTDDQLLAVAVGAPNLRSIYIRLAMHGVSAHGLTAALPFLRQLRSIHVASSSLICALYAIDSYCPFLETYRGPVDEQLLTILSSCEHLTELNVFSDVSNKQKFTSTTASFLASAGNNLRSIELPRCDGSVVLPLVARYCKKLCQMFISRLSGVNDALVEEVLSSCGSTLVCMNLTRECTDASLVSVGSHCPNLTALDLFGNENITDDGVIAMAASCPHLQRLGLKWCNLSGVSLSALAEHPALRVVGVSDWASKQDIGVVRARRAERGLQPMITRESAVVSSIHYLY